VAPTPTRRELLFAAAASLARCSLVDLRETQLADEMDAEGLDRAVATIGDAHVEYWHGGSGPAVVLLHGFGGDARLQWHEQAIALSSSFTIIAPDLVWFGGSDSKSRDLSVAYQARTVEGLIDHVSREPVAVIGSSYGGFVALDLAARRPERIARLILADSPGPVWGASDVDDLKRRYGVRELDELFVPEERAALRRLLKASYVEPPFTPWFVLDDVLAHAYGVHRTEKRALINALPREAERLGGLSSPRCKTLVVWGRNDAIFPLHLGEALVARIAGDVRLEVIDHAGHVPNLEQSEAFDRAIREFLVSD
jgi:pimeloyl-ACP methyl ester carboxylesterase